jgi:hypothetical protein
MRVFFQSGSPFLLLALLCLAIGVVSRGGAAFLGAATLWFVLGIVLRSRNLP